MEGPVGRKLMMGRGEGGHLESWGLFRPIGTANQELDEGRGKGRCGRCCVGIRLEWSHKSKGRRGQREIPERRRAKKAERCLGITWK